MSGRNSWPELYPGASEHYGIDWVDRLGEQSIVSVDFTVLLGNVTLSGESYVDTSSFVRVTGVSEGATVILCKIGTSDGDTFMELAELRVLPLPA